MLNKVMIIGGLGQNPEVRYMTSGDPVANFSVATSEVYYDKDKNKQEKTEWHRVSVYGKQAETCNTYLAKGSLVYIEGSLQTRKWQDKQGQDRTSTEINARLVRFLDKKGDNQNQSSSPFDNNNNEDYGSPFPSEARNSEMDDMPF